MLWLKLTSSFRCASNTRAPPTTYSISTSTSGAGVGPSNGTRLPPLQALLSPGPALTILKRPSSAPAGNNATRANPVAGSSSGSDDTVNSRGGQQSSKTLSQREKEYEEARRRIYGGNDTSSNPSTMSETGLESAVQNIALGQHASTRRKPGSDSRRRGNGRPRGGGGATVVGGAATPPGSSSGTTRAPRGPNSDAGGFGFRNPESIQAPAGQGQRERSTSGRGRGRRDGGAPGTASGALSGAR